MTSPANMPQRRPQPQQASQQPRPAAPAPTTRSGEFAQGHKRGHHPTIHVMKKAQSLGVTLSEVMRAADTPEHTFESRRFPGQMRHVRNGIVAVVDPKDKKVITAYKAVEETDIRPDQQSDADARRFQDSREARQRGAAPPPLPPKRKGDGTPRRNPDGSPRRYTGSV